MVDDALIVLEGGRVLWSGSESIRGAGLDAQVEADIAFDGFVMPGVVDRHVHIALSDPGAVVAGGVTAVRDLGWPADEIFPLADASESPSFNGPLIRATGPIITCHGGYPTRATWGPKGTGMEVQGPEESAEVVRSLLERSGTPVVKVALNSDAGPTISDEDLVAVCDAAHSAEAIVTAHAQGRGQVERALGAGVDELAHCPWSERLEESLVTAMARRMRIVSTLDILSFGKDTPELRLATENLSRFMEAGGRVAYGTDLGNRSIPPGIHVGEAMHLLRAGLSEEQVLEVMTFRPLEPGEPADLVGVMGNPLEDLGSLGTVGLVIRGGRVIVRPGR